MYYSYNGVTDMNRIILPSILCGCFVGCDTMQRKVDSSPENECCEDWDVIALEHCPKGKNHFVYNL